MECSDQTVHRQDTSIFTGFLPVGIEVVKGKGVRLFSGNASVCLEGEIFHMESKAHLIPEISIGYGEFTILSSILHMNEETLIKKVAWLRGVWHDYDEKAINSTNLSDNFLFLRKDGISFLLSLDFPAGKISDEGIFYEPYERLEKESDYECHTLTIAACRLTGEKIGNFDKAEIEAASKYIEKRFPLRFRRPMNVAASITNRMTECSDGRIFYSMYDNPTLYLNPELLKKDIDLCAEVGLEYFQLFEGVFDWPDREKTGKVLEELVRHANSKGVRIGDYVHPGDLYCPHYNYEHRYLDKPEWRRLDDKGDRDQFCLGCADYLEYLSTELIRHNREFGEEFICLDMLNIYPCHDTSHGHPAGDVYSQVRGLVRLMKGLSDISPEYLVWTNCGNWIEFMPKLVWYNPNVYLTDPHATGYRPELNMLKYLADRRRDEMVTVHEKLFVPYRFFCNLEYYFTSRSRINDLRMFEYSLLQGLAVTPNLGMGELRTFLNRIRADKKEYCIGFIKKWFRFIRANYHYWVNTIRVGGLPGEGTGEVYSHILSDSGYVCIVNQNAYSVKTCFSLDRSIGLEKGSKFIISEVYPGNNPIEEQNIPYASYGDEITLRIPPCSVRYLQIQPFAVDETGETGETKETKEIEEKKEGKIVVYGLPAESRKVEDGYELYLTAPQGKTCILGILLPKGETIAEVEAVQAPPKVEMYTFPASARVLESIGNTARIEVEFPRDSAPSELRNWTVSPGDIRLNLPAEGIPFKGALASGVYSDDYRIILKVKTANTHIKGNLVKKPDDESEKTANVEIPFSGTWIFKTEFNLPFIEPMSFGAKPGYEDDTIIQLVFDDVEKVSGIKASLNGIPVEVRRYRYALKRDWYSYYIELTDNVNEGLVLLDLEIEWNESAKLL